MSEVEIGNALRQVLLSETGSRFEGNVFSVLRRSTFVVRSWEFALADGAIVCDEGFNVNESYAQRFAKMQDPFTAKEQPGVVLFDVKSSSEEGAGAQGYVGSSAQRHLVAFYICICAADPTFVELRPNFHQDTSVLSDSTILKHYILSRDRATEQHKTESLAAQRQYDDRELRTVSSRQLPWLPWAYSGLDPSGNPYRMPISLLNVAIERVRGCALAGGDCIYENPWTRVRFVGWRPLVVRTGASNCIRPIQGSPHFTAYQATTHIFDCIKTAQIVPDFVSLQPSLADFSLKIKDRQGQWQMYLVQHKIGRARIGVDSLYQEMEIARGGSTENRFFFHAHDRFDYLWYEFPYRQSKSSSEERKFFLLPERVLPDCFYTGTEQFAEFNPANFAPYLVDMTTDMGWIWAVARILRAEMDRGPRGNAERPCRSYSLEQKLIVAKPGSSANIGPSDTMSALADSPLRQAGRAEYAQASTESARRFFSYITTILAERRRGLLVPFSSNHPVADLGYCAYAWSTEEQKVYHDHNKLPASAHHLPFNTRLLAISLVTQCTSTSHRGPSVRPSIFRRLDRTAVGRLVVWDLAGPAAFRDFLPVVIPSEDLRATMEQRRLFEAKTTNPDENALPVLQALLTTGLSPTDYHVGASGSLISNQRQSWYDMVTLLDNFLGGCDEAATLEHPPGYGRDPMTYCHELQYYNTCSFTNDRREEDLAVLNERSTRLGTHP